MKFEDVIRKFLPKTFSPASIESIAKTLESFGKTGAGILAILYVVGLIIIGLYNSSLHIRSVELFKVKYLFVGFYYFTFLFLHLIFPKWWSKKVTARVLYLLLIFTIIIFLNEVNNRYLVFILENWIYGNSFFDFKKIDIYAINKNFGVLAIVFIFANIIFSTAIKTKKENGESVSSVNFWLITLAVILNYFTFIKFVFPNIPDTIGGGKAPIINIEFSENVPQAITGNFDNSDELGAPFPYYLARLIYKDGDTVFLSGLDWLTDDVFELKSSDIRMIRYIGFNPLEMGQSGSSP
jgi:hypothetical protein